MNLDSNIILLIQAGIVVITYWIFLRKLDVPYVIQILTACAYVTVHLFIIKLGLASALYLDDLIAPFLLIYLTRTGAIYHSFRNKIFLSFFLLLIIAPLLSVSILIFLGEFAITSKDILENGLWFYRNIMFLLVFSAGLTAKLNKDQMKNFIVMNIVYGLILSFFGLVSYLTSLDLATFERIVLDDTENRLGLGFMGLFRAGVGQWFAILLILATGAFNSFSRKIKLASSLLFLTGASVVLLSFSRAGLMGTILGVSLVLLLSRGKSRFIIVSVVSLIIFSWLTLEENAVIDRYLPKSGITQARYQDEAVASRISGWIGSVQYFQDNLSVLLLGVGPANRDRVYDIIGLYGAHDEYIDVIYRFGFIGFILLAATLILLVKQFYAVNKYHKGPKRNQIAKTFLVIIIANSVMAFTQTHLIHDFSTYTLGVYIYLLYGTAIGAQWNNIPVISGRGPAKQF